MPPAITLDEVLQTTRDGFAGVNGRLHAQEQRMSRLEREVRLARSGADVSLPGVEEGIGKDQFSMFRAFKMLALVRAGASRDSAVKQADAGYENEVHRNVLAKRDLTVESDPAGALFLPTQIGGPFIDKLRAAQIVQALGATVLTGLAGEMKVPAQTGAATAYWVGDNSAPTKSEPTFGQKTMRPKKVGALVKMSNSLLRQAVNPGIEALVRDDLAKVIGLEMDLQYLFGTGGDNKPLGLWEMPGFDKTTVAIGANGGDLAWFTVLSLEGLLEDRNAMIGTPGLAMHPKVRRVLKKERIPQFVGDPAGAYAFPPVMTNAQLEAFLGYKIQASTQVPTNKTKGTSTDCSPVILGIWPEFVIGMWANLELRISDEAGDASGGAFPQDQSWLRAFAETDCMARHIEAFAGCADARVNNA